MRSDDHEKEKNRTGALEPQNPDARGALMTRVCAVVAARRRHLTRLTASKDAGEGWWQETLKLSKKSGAPGHVRGACGSLGRSVAWQEDLGIMWVS